MESELPAEPPAQSERGYAYQDAQTNCSHTYLMGPLQEILASLRWPNGAKRLFDLGCGNGSVDAQLTRQGYEMVGVDPSEEGIAQAHRVFPELSLHRGSAYDNLAGMYGRFPALISLEVVEHVYFPRKYAACVYDLLEPGGTAIISTPYHSYLKNLALAASGALDRHFTALWDHGHIKFWSVRTLTQLLCEAGFRQVSFRRVGRVPALAKSMIAIATK
jgi:2-polyprenyl-6-hydroxyphenyl methylase/3-demethylubiquinone-9 3-methyltransferase